MCSVPDCDPVPVPVLWGRGVGTQEPQVRGAAGREGQGPGAPVRASWAFIWCL